MDESTRGKEDGGATVDDPILFTRKARLELGEVGCQRGLDSGRHVLFLSTAQGRLQKVFVES